MATWYPLTLSTISFVPRGLATPEGAVPAAAVVPTAAFGGAAVEPPQPHKTNPAATAEMVKRTTLVTSVVLPWGSGLYRLRSNTGIAWIENRPRQSYGR